MRKKAALREGSGRKLCRRRRSRCHVEKTKRESRGARRSKAGGREASGGAEAGVHTEEGRQGAI